jgi:hypothetical protein
MFADLEQLIAQLRSDERRTRDWFTHRGWEGWTEGVGSGDRGEKPAVD